MKCRLYAALLVILMIVEQPTSCLFLIRFTGLVLVEKNEFASLEWFCEQMGYLSALGLYVLGSNVICVVVIS